MFKIRKQRYFILALGCIGIVATGIYFFPIKQETQYADAEVRAYFSKLKPKYLYKDCLVWVDYQPPSDRSKIDKKKHDILRRTITSFNKYMLFLLTTDLGGRPGIQLLFKDFCDQKMDLAQLYAQNLVKYHPDITKAKAIAHSAERDNITNGVLINHHLDTTESAAVTK